jgi:hypothetical protein
MNSTTKNLNFQFATNQFEIMKTEILDDEAEKVRLNLKYLRVVGASFKEKKLEISSRKRNRR